MPPAALDQLIAAGPRWQRPAMRALLTLGTRPRGRALLALVKPADHAAAALIAMARYDEPQQALALGWDADAVVARGRELRRAEGRP
jgi:hypothetical protein